MLSQAQIKLIRALQQKKNRMLHGSFVVEGEKIIAELLRSDYVISGFFALKQWLIASRHLIPSGTAVHEVSDNELTRISVMSTPNQVLAVVKIPDARPLHANQWDGMALYLDCIQDPGNLGTIIRTADWFGVDRIFCSDDTVELYNPKVIQATMGSFLRITVSRISLSDLLQNTDIKPVVYGAALDGENIFRLKAESPALLIVGNESKGISKNLDQYIDRRILIPGQQTGADSLNVSVASGIIMAWFSK